MTTLISSEFFISDTTDSGFASRPDIGIDAQGNFVVVWNQFNTSIVDDDGVLARRFDSEGEPEGDLIIVDPFTSVSDPVVAVAADGRFVVVWDDTSVGNDIAAQIYEADGDIDVSVFEVTDDDGVVSTSDPDVAMDVSNGDFVVTWVQVDDDNDRSIVAQQFNIDGEEDGDLITVETIDNDDFINGQFVRDPAVAMDDSGDFVIVWEQDTQENDDDDTDIFARRYSSSGTALDSTPFLVNTEQENDQFDPDVATDANGDFTIVWFSEFINQVGLTPDLDDGVYARQYDSNGTPRGEQFAVAAPDTGDGFAFAPAVAMDSSGDTLIVWENFDADNSGDSSDIFAQEYNSSGDAVGTPFRINDDEDIDGDQDNPAIAITAGGDAVVAWQSDPTTTLINDQNILGQRVSLSGSSSTNNTDNSDNTTDTGNNTNTGSNIVPDNTEIGSNADDQLSGTADSDLLQGLGGADTILGRQGDDALSGGRGRDTIRGGGGADEIVGGDSADELFGNGGADDLNGNGGRDTLLGGAGDDIVFGGVGRDKLQGNGGNDFLSGGNDNDLLIGAGGNDSLYGGRGQDTLRGGGGTANFLDGDKGNDVLIGREGSVDTFAIVQGDGFDDIRNFTFREDFLGFRGENFIEFNAIEYIRDSRGTIVQINGQSVALIRGVDLTINVLFNEISTVLTPDQLSGNPPST